MVGFHFDSPPADSAELNLSAECERQLLPLVRGIVEAAVAAGWSREDVLLAMVELSWDLYEKRRGDL
ncbi:hypothetical protein JQK88_08145 [Mesorhizobium caraganae]|uniref:hypothetical protein n=1 Tax=Mesorhizobium caraganae TaxID=483206 RepID=UPI00177EA527|nr:hypothetical protein [Mesorhizobium caraganae]MBM2711221.1 hypothetical protein [Mesorhizobium caraganae]